MACKRVIIAGERVVKDFVGKYLFSLANQNPFPECFCVVSDYPELGSAENLEKSDRRKAGIQVVGATLLCVGYQYIMQYSYIR